MKETGRAVRRATTTIELVYLGAEIDLGDILCRALNEELPNAALSVNDVVDELLAPGSDRPGIP